MRSCSRDLASCLCISYLARVLRLAGRHMSGRHYVPFGHAHDESTGLLDSAAVSQMPSAASSAQNLLLHSDTLQHSNGVHEYPPSRIDATSALRAVQSRDERTLDGILERGRVGRVSGNIELGRGELAFMAASVFAVLVLTIFACVAAIATFNW